MEKGIILSPTITRPTEKTLKVRGHERGSAGGIHNNIILEWARGQSPRKMKPSLRTFSQKGAGGGVGWGEGGTGPPNLPIPTSVTTDPHKIQVLN